MAGIRPDAGPERLHLGGAGTRPAAAGGAAARGGGPAEQRNLYLITGQTNANQKNQIEQRGLRVVPRVNAGNELIHHKVSVRNVSALSEIMTTAGNPTGLFELSATFQCGVADYQYCSDDTLRRNAVRTVDVRSEFVFHPSGGRAFDTITRPCSR